MYKLCRSHVAFMHEYLHRYYPMFKMFNLRNTDAAPTTVLPHKGENGLEVWKGDWKYDIKDSPLNYNGGFQ
jgi:hypothetical protein